MESVFRGVAFKNMYIIWEGEHITKNIMAISVQDHSKQRNNITIIECLLKVP